MFWLKHKYFWPILSSCLGQSTIVIYEMLNTCHGVNCVNYPVVLDDLGHLMPMSWFLDYNANPFFLLICSGAMAWVVVCAAAWVVAWVVVCVATLVVEGLLVLITGIGLTRGRKGWLNLYLNIILKTQCLGASANGSVPTVEIIIDYQTVFPNLQCLLFWIISV